MEIEITITAEPIAEKILPPRAGAAGAWVEFRGNVRGEENGRPISALEYEVYPEMAPREIHRLLAEIAGRHPALAVRVIHRTGIIPVGETAIYVGAAAAHRREAFALLTEFMDRLKQDVPIWKRRALPVPEQAPAPPVVKNAASALRTLDEARAEIDSHCQPLPAVRIALTDALGRTLRETVFAPSDLPDCDRSTRDGYAVLADDPAEYFQIVDALHAADWKPRRLNPGEAVRIATGAALPGENLRVIMQEDVERHGERIRVLERDGDRNVRQRGEDIASGQPLVKAGTSLDAGRLALLATAGCVQPAVNPRLRILHFTTGDEVIPPGQTPKPGQVRDSNSILIRGLLRNVACELEQAHLPENSAAAWKQLPLARIEYADVILVSGGASVGDKDFTRPLLERLGFQTVFSQVNLRPGRPLIFGQNGRRIAFGLPGNPLSHFACYHLFVARALARLGGAEPVSFRIGRLASKLEDTACPREALWPVRQESTGSEVRLHPLKWSSSGDVTCFSEADGLLRVPINCNFIAAGTELDFLPANS